MKHLRWLQIGQAFNSQHELLFPRRFTPALLVGLCLGVTSPLPAKDGNGDDGRRYLQTNLVSDVAGLAAKTDPNLVNAWGLTRSATGPWWVADNGTGLSTVYDGSGTISTLVVTVPPPAGGTSPAAPTGIAFNGSTTDFMLAPSKPAHFVFATEDGTISAWNSGTTAALMVDRSGAAVYKGLAIAQNNGASFLYAANFKAGSVDVFDSTFKAVSLGAGAFTDPRVPAGYAPFNVLNLGGELYVAFAQTEAGSIDEVHGPGKGYVSVFSPAGEFRRRLQWGAWFNAPWGIALAPSGFGRASGQILVGQFGSGRIATFDAANGEFRGFLHSDKGRPLTIDGLWALGFGNGGSAGSETTLYFSAGIDDEAHGLFGTIAPSDDKSDN